ncbi:family 1 glycosylhydrolase [Sphingobium chungangianum]|jgi:beta-glucosidase
MTTIDRRQALGFATGAAATLAVPAGARRVSNGRFLWGAATAGYQIEGNAPATDIWLLEHMTPTIFAEPSGDADDSLHRWREDMAIAKAIGLNCYRFSVEWSRIEPDKGQFSIAYLDFYKEMIDHCRELELAPVVTFNHFTTPRWFAASGGWTQTDAAALFGRYCDRVARAMADGISHAVTLNEPNLSLGGNLSALQLGGASRAKMQAMIAAAAKASGSDRFDVLNFGDPEPMMPGVIAGHKTARAAIKAVRGDLPVGLSLAITDDVGVGPGNLLKRKRQIVYEPFFALARDDDFIGVQTYGRQYIGKDGPVDVPADMPKRPNGKEWFPTAIGNTIRYAHQATGKPVLITENGIDASDDAERQKFIPEAIASVEAAMRDGVPVEGYIHWSLLDNFEWMLGYGPKYGLVAVDRTTFKRTPKPSAALFGRIARAGGMAA